MIIIEIQLIINLFGKKDNITSLSVVERYRQWPTRGLKEHQHLISLEGLHTKEECLSISLLDTYETCTHVIIFAPAPQTAELIIYIDVSKQRTTDI